MTIPELRLKIKEVGERLQSRELYTILLIIFVGFASFGLGRLSKLHESRVPIRIENALAETVAAVGVAESPLTKGVPPPSEAGVVSSSVTDKGLRIKDSAAPALGGQIVASRGGSKYHFPWCSGAQRISEANKIWFNSIEEARKAGYTPAGNCKGLK